MPRLRQLGGHSLLLDLLAGLYRSQNRIDVEDETEGPLSRAKQKNPLMCIGGESFALSIIYLNTGKLTVAFYGFAA